MMVFTNRDVNSCAHSLTDWLTETTQCCIVQWLTSRQVAIALEPRTDWTRLVLMAAAEYASAAATVNCTITLDAQQHRLTHPATTDSLKAKPHQLRIVDVHSAT